MAKRNVFALKGPYATDQAASMLANALQELPDNFLMCRDMRHAWELDKDYYVERNVHVSRGNIRRDLSCLRCGMMRVEKYVQSRWGLDKIGQNYIQPDGYAIHGVPRGNKPASIVQGEQYRRAMEKVAKASRNSG